MASENDMSNLDNDALNEFGFCLSKAYRYAYRFYKENEGKSVHLAYNDKLALVAYTHQVMQGPFNPDKVKPVGALDIIGKDRRAAWSSLGDISEKQAMYSFLKSVNQLMPHFKPYLEAVKAEEQQELIRSSHEREQAEANVARKMEAIKKEKEAELECQRQEEERRRIKDALNQQTFSQFRAYAEQQYPNNPDRQAVLVRQLQEQHYMQYMQQVYQQQKETQASKAILAINNSTASTESAVQCHMPGLTPCATNDGISECLSSQLSQNLNLGTESVLEADDSENYEANANDSGNKGVARLCESGSGDEEGHQCFENCEYCSNEVSPASMWTKKEITEFKESLRSEGGYSILKVGHGESVTVRVPTRSDGNALFWEFATDGYDVAFGLFFEWTDTEDNEISVYVSDSEDDDAEEFSDEATDPESGGTNATLMDKGPPTSVIIPIYRRDCHEEVYVGTHHYPGKGVYLLKFDNTYSLWRSKTLYYRVYYTK